MIQEQYVSFETAKLLKEKGFDWEVHRSYLVNDNCFAPADVNDLPYRKDAIRIPTQQMAMKWLREVHNIALNVCYLLGMWSYSMYRTDVSSSGFNSEDFDNYEQACEAAIQYALNLIDEDSDLPYDELIEKYEKENEY